jgi:hypothetical protein
MDKNKSKFLFVLSSLMVMSSFGVAGEKSSSNPVVSRKAKRSTRLKATKKGPAALAKTARTAVAVDPLAEEQLDTASGLFNEGLSDAQSDLEQN